MKINNYYALIKIIRRINYIYLKRYYIIGLYIWGGGILLEKEEIFEGLKNAVVEGDEDKCKELATLVIDSNIDAYEAIMEGCGAGMGVCSELYDKGDMFVPEILMSAEAMYAAMHILRPHITVEATGKSKGKVVIGVIEGDLHDIGKNLVKIMLDAAGFEIIDLGRDVPVDNFVNTAKDEKVEIVAMSTLMTTTMPGMLEVVRGLRDKDIRQNVKVLVGGAPVSDDFVSRIEADAYAEDASKAIKVASSLIEELRGEDRWRSLISSRTT